MSKRCQSSLFQAFTERYYFKCFLWKKACHPTCFSPETLKVKRDLCHSVNNEALCNTNAPILEAENISKVRVF